MEFDIAGARKAGATDDEIASFLSKQVDFDYQGARHAGHSDTEIANWLSQQMNKGKGKGKGLFDDIVEAPPGEEPVYDYQAESPKRKRAQSDGAWSTIKDVAGELPKGVVRGLDQIGAMGGGAIRLVGRWTGIDAASDAGDSIARYYAGRARRPEVQQDTSGQYGSLKYFLGAAGEMAPELVPIGMGASIGKAALTRRAISKLGARYGMEGAKSMAKVAGSVEAKAVNRAAKQGTIGGIIGGQTLTEKGNAYIKSVVDE